MKTFKQYLSELKKPRWEVPAEPGSTPTPEGKIKLYHQTSMKNLNAIRRQGIQLSKAKGYEGPKAIYASPPSKDNKGFYGPAHNTPTAEFHVDKDEYKAPFVHRDSVPAKDITAHKEWHSTVRYIDADPELKAAVLRGEHDHLMKEKSSKYAKAIRFVKRREQAKKLKEETLDETALKAFFYAKNAHKGQTRSDKSRYIRHPARVAAIVKKYKTSKSIDDILSAAYLHDTIEDTKTTEQDIKDLFGGLVSSLVKELTSNKEDIEKVGKTQYLLDKMSNMSSWALVIKLADRLDNVSDLRTAKSESWRNKYKKETIDILNQLEKKRELTSTHKKIIDEIRKKIEEAGK